MLILNQIIGTINICNIFNKVREPNITKKQG